MFFYIFLFYVINLAHKKSFPLKTGVENNLGIFNSLNQESQIHIINFLKNKKTNPQLSQDISELLLIGFDGGDLQETRYLEKIKSSIENGLLKNIHIYGHVRSEKKLKELLDFFNQHNSKGIVSTEMEGGFVDRFDLIRKEKNKDYLPASLSAQLSTEEKKEQYERMAQEIKKYGFNLNLAPVVDLYYKNAFLNRENRTFSNNKESVVENADLFIKAMHKYGVRTALKHFPGLGGATGDPHKSELQHNDDFFKIDELNVYKELMKKNHVDAILTAHVINKKFDEIYPASLSKATIQDLLRDKLEFQGLVISDEIQMRSLAKNIPQNVILKQLIESGNDLILYFSSPSMSSLYNLHNLIFDLVKNNQELLNRIKKIKQRTEIFKNSITKSQNQIMD